MTKQVLCFPFVLAVVWWLACSATMLCMSCCGTVVPAADGVPRVSTPEERAAIAPYVQTAEDVLVAALAIKGISPDDFGAGMQVLTAFRQEVDESAFVPVDWPGMVRKALRLTVVAITAKALKDAAHPPPR